MFYEYENADHEAKAMAILTGLGEFIIAFERVCAGMRNCIFCAFRREGLKNQGLAQVFLNKVAAESLRSTLGGVFSELQGQDEEDKEAVKRLLSRIDTLGSTRNKLSHAEWFLNCDYENANDEFTALALKHNVSQNGGAFSLRIPVTQAFLNGQMREATEILVLLNRLAVCLNQTGFKVSEMLSRPL